MTPKALAVLNRVSFTFPHLSADLKYEVRLDLQGWPEPIRTYYMKRLNHVLLLALLTASWALGEKSPELLVEAAQVRALSAEQAAGGYPVHVRGVITDAVPAPDFFVQDKSAGVYVEGNRSHLYRHRLGDVIELDGTTGPGRFAPVIRETSSRIVGTSSLPKTRLYSFLELAHGQFDSQWVQIRGIIRSVSLDRQSWREPTLAMTVSSGVGQFRVRVPVNRNEDFSSWLGNEALISGVSGSLSNAERQFVGLLLYVPSLSFIQVEGSVNDVSAVDLLRFSPQQQSGHRVRIRGVVSYQDAGNSLFLLDRNKGLRVLTQQDSPVSPGDVVDVVGFPAIGESAPVLEDAIFTRVRRQEPPIPVAFDSAANWERYDGALVSLDAKLLHYEQRSDRPSLLLQHAGIVFTATLPSESASSKVLSIPISSDVRLTGICLVRNGGIWRVPQSFRLLLRSDRDVQILRKPSWWNLRHTVWLLEIMIVVLCAVLAWTMLLRRRVRDQMEVIRQKLRSGAILEERNRIARELHDTLEQDLAGITIHLDLAVDRFKHDPALSQQALETARRMSRRSMVEARRSVWDLRSHLLENGTLSSALAKAVEPMAARSRVKIDVNVKGEAVRLNSAVEMNALRIGQEAIGNAIKHARATTIQVDLEYKPETLRLSITDDGCGFDEDTAAMAYGGHFGLLDMKERADGLGSRFEIRSTPGHGTRVDVEMPLGMSKPSHGELKADSYSRR